MYTRPSSCPRFSPFEAAWVGRSGYDMHIHLMARHIIMYTRPSSCPRFSPFEAAWVGRSGYDIMYDIHCMYGVLPIHSCSYRVLLTRSFEFPTVAFSEVVPGV